MGMRTIQPAIPSYLLTLIETLRNRLRAADFQARHRVRPEAFTRACPLTFPVLLLFVLQQTVKSLQRICTSSSMTWPPDNSLHRSPPARSPTPVPSSKPAPSANSIKRACCPRSMARSAQGNLGGAGRGKNRT